MRDGRRSDKTFTLRSGKFTRDVAIKFAESQQTLVLKWFLSSAISTMTARSTSPDIAKRSQPGVSRTLSRDFWQQKNFSRPAASGLISTRQAPISARFD